MTLIFKVVCWTEPEDDGIMYFDIHDNIDGIAHGSMELESFEVFKSLLLEGASRYQDGEVVVEIYTDDVKHAYMEGGEWQQKK